ncbi:MAG: IPT/TIG domain-containing protein [bacterium]
MIKQGRKFLIIIAAIILLFSGLLAFNVQAQTADLWGDEIAGQDFGAEKMEEIGLGKEDPRVIVINIIRIALGLLGILAVVLMMYGGYIWMTASGDPEKVDKAKKILKNSIIGILIILACFAIVTYILSRLLYSTGAVTGTGCITGQTERCSAGDCWKTCINNSWGPCVGSDCYVGKEKEIPCDGNAILPGCQADDSICDPYIKYCDENSCLCISKGGHGDPCGPGANNAECNVNNDRCESYLTCEFDADNSQCECSGPPRIDAISPVGGFCDDDIDIFCIKDSDCATGKCNQTVPNGAVGNLATIHGRGFLDYDSVTSKVLFWGGAGFSVQAQLAETVNPACDNSWTDRQIIIVVPVGAVIGAIKVEAANGSDVTNLPPGPNIEDFKVNKISRPGLCKLDPDEGQLDTILTYSGVKLLNAAAYFGNVKQKVKANNPLFVNSLSGTARVPNIQNGKTTTFAQRVAEPNSNYLYFKKIPEPVEGPVIVSIDPSSGPEGQYVTIRGSGFGNLKGSNTVYFGKQEADFEFPKVCAYSIWQNNQIVVKVPDALVDDQAYDIEVIVGDKNALSPEKFTFDKDEALRPGLCRIEPIFGEHNDNISLWGEYFDKFGANSIVRFYINKDQSDKAITYWDKDTVLGVKPDRADTIIHQQAVTGPVKIVKGSLGTESNGLNLTIGKCQQDADCGIGVCCPAGTPEQGRCQPSADKCYGNVDSSVYEWQFSTGADVRCPPEKPVQCEDNSCCSSLDNCEDPGSGITTCFDNDSCSGYNINICFDSIFCPNSPGNCSPNPSITTYGATCDCALLGCINCSYNSGLNRCVSNAQACSLDTESPDIDNDLARQYCALYNGQPKWHLETRQTCPVREAPFNNPIKLASGDCVYPDADCDMCTGNLSCVDDNNIGVCATKMPVCPNNFQCINDICTRSQGLCECCCDKTENKPDNTNEACCSPLTCDNDCGSSAVDLKDSDDQWGYCSGCANVGTTQEEHDAACNCEGSSGKYCDTSIPGGVCRDCSRIGGLSECSLHSACCVDNQRGNACAGVKESRFLEDGFQYCAYYGCEDNCSAPNKDKEYSKVKTCEDECPITCDAEPAIPGCQKDETMCPAEKPYCNDKCICDEEREGPGDPCYDDTNSCTLKCIIGYTCLDANGKSGVGCIPPGIDDSCKCCCEPSDDKCSSISSNLFCQPNIVPCNKENRGMCCGCQSDEECGDKELYGCGNDTCCRSRPVVESVLPEPGDDEVCRNTIVSVKFDQKMNKGSLSGNIIVAGDYGDNLCPSNTELLTELAQEKPAGFFARIVSKIKEFLAKLFPIFSKHQAAAADTSNFCAIKGRTSSHDIGDEATVADFFVMSPLDPNITYYVIVKGDKNLSSQNGVLSAYGIGMNGNNLTAVSSFNGITYPKAHIWSFKTGDEICQIDRVEIDPAQHLFQKPHSDYSFIAKAVASNNDIIVSIPGVYSWSWTWSSDNVDIAQIKADLNDTRLAIVTSGNHEDAETWVRAIAAIIEDKISPLSTKGREITGKARIILFFCDNPWPLVTDPNAWPIRWEDSDDNCTPGLEGDGCIDNDFEIYYCRDKGSESTMDDLPSLTLEPVVRGIFEYVSANGLVQVIKDFLFFREDRPFSLNATDWTVKNDDNAQKGEQAIVEWNDSISNNGYSFKIYLGEKSKKYDDYVLSDHSPKEISGLKNNTIYYFAMTVINDKNVESDYSNEQSVEISDIKAPDDPINVSAIADTTDANNKKIEVSWDFETNDVAKYYVEYGPYQEPAVRVDAGLNSQYIINNLDNLNAQDYYVRVIAADPYDNESGSIELSCSRDCIESRCACN